MSCYNQFMKISIIGGGQVGSTIAKQLSYEGHDITLIDSDSEIIRNLKSDVDGFLTVGNGMSPKDLLRAGFDEADVVVGVSSKDEVNLLAAQWAKKMGNPVTIARVRHPEYNSNSLDLPDGLKEIDRIINPDNLTVQSIVRLVETPGANEAFDFNDGEILLRGFIVPKDAPIVGKSLGHIRKVCDMDHFLVVAIIRDDEVIIPNGDDVIKPNDNIFVLLPKDALPLFLPLINRFVGDVNRVIISGATGVGIQLALELEKEISQVVLIDSDIKRCEQASEVLTHTQVMCGNSTQVNFLKECRVDASELFIAVSKDYEKNLITTLLARQYVNGRIMMVTSNPDLVPILNVVGPDVLINPRLLTIGTIMETIRQGRILSVYKMREQMAEALEVVLPEHSPLVGKALKTLKLPKGAIIGAVCKADGMLIPTGETVLGAKERIVVFATETAIEQLERLWR